MPSPIEVQREGIKWFPTVITLGVLITIAWAVLAVVNGQFFWWLQKQNLAHQYQNQTSSSQYQQGWLLKLDNDYASMTGDQAAAPQNPDQAVAKAAVLGDANTVCYDYTKINLSLTQVSQDIISWANVNCSGPVVSQSSGLRS